MKIIIAIGLLAVLFIFFAISYYLNKFKVKEDSNFTIKGYDGACKTCEQTSCSLHPEYLKDEEEDD